jgi:hypothetical protein
MHMPSSVPRYVAQHYTVLLCHVMNEWMGNEYQFNSITAQQSCTVWEYVRFPIQYTTVHGHGTWAFTSLWSTYSVALR